MQATDGSDDYDELITDLVAQDCPALFAVLHEHGDRVRAEVAGWGIAWSDRTEVVFGGGQLSVGSPEDAAAFFGRSLDGDMRLVWPDGRVLRDAVLDLAGTHPAGGVSS